MAQNIQALLKELISYTHISTSTVSTQAKSYLDSMRKEFEELELSNDVNKQSKMISLFIGGTIYALKCDDYKYRYSSFYNFELYPGTMVEGVLKDLKDLKKETTPIEQMYAIGNKALLELPQAFNGDLFKKEFKLVGTTETIPFFPDLKNNSDKIDLLVRFCIKYSQDLDQPEVETDDLATISLKFDAPSPVSLKFDAPSPEVEAKTTNSSSMMDISMQILGGFMAVVGCAAVAAAFILLNAATFGTVGLIVAGLGLASTLVGVGLFATGTYKNSQKTPNESSDDSASFAY